VDGQLREYPQGSFQLRYYSGGRTMYTPVGEDATEAENRRATAERVARIKHEGSAIGLSFAQLPEAKIRFSCEFSVDFEPRWHARIAG
jgi:hypothetical protein